VSLGEALKAWDRRVRAVLLPGLELAEEPRSRGSVLREPASEAQIAAAEARLGTRLPESYRRFLAISNGAFASSIGAATTRDPDSGFLPVERVQWAALADPFLVDLWSGVTDDPDWVDEPPTPGAEPVEVDSFAALEDALIISGQVDSFVDMLVPIDGGEEWQFWTFFREGPWAHRSFADWLRWELNQPVPDPLSPEEIAVLIARVREGEVHLLYELERTQDPRLLDLAIDVLDDEHIFAGLVTRLGGDRPHVRGLADRERIINAASVLSALRRPEAEAPLRRVFERELAWDAHLNVIGALIECGAPDADRLLRDAAQHPEPQIRNWAILKLGERAEPDLDLLRQATDDEEQLVRNSAVFALAKHRPPDLGSLLRNAMNDQQSRRWVLEELVNHEPASAIEMLRHALSDSDLETRRYALSELVERRAPGAIEQLRTAARDTAIDPDTQSLRKWATRRLQQPDLTR
jgi:hypothetical protein